MDRNEAVSLISECYELSFKKMFRSFQSRFLNFSNAEKEELIHNAYLKNLEALVDGSIMSGWDTESIRDALPSYVYTTVKRDLINLFHRKKRFRTNESKIKVQLYPNFFANLDVGIEEFEKKDCIKKQILFLLKEKQILAEIFILKEIDGYANSEITAMYQQSSRWVSDKLYESKRELKELLVENCSDFVE